MPGSVAVLSEQPQLRAMLSPLRRQILLLLREPDSATGLAKRLGIARQKINYHLRALEEAGLVELVEERPRRGFLERIFRASASSFVIQAAGLDDLVEGDRHSSQALLASAARTMSDVAILTERAGAAGKRLITMSIDGEVTLPSPTDAKAFSEELAQAVSAIAERYAKQGKGRRYRFSAGLHPVITKTPIEARKEAKR